ncbi:hypothetical protein AB4341_17365 [Vibrio breoganii]|uniref:hypothetical protein n=1 Tax=Vibrio breoganii TaxID=553239 RepID=UPI000C826D8B|nr:hypothetical protein [Vibrio breoganii]PMO60060.1 hypothetical protein BCT07_00245 [Vibrio breoganii]
MMKIKLLTALVSAAFLAGCSSTGHNDSNIDPGFDNPTAGIENPIEKDIDPDYGNPTAGIENPIEKEIDPEFGNPSAGIENPIEKDDSPDWGVPVGDIGDRKAYWNIEQSDNVKGLYSVSKDGEVVGYVSVDEQGNVHLKNHNNSKQVELPNTKLVIDDEGSITGVTLYGKEGTVIGSWTPEGGLEKVSPGMPDNPIHTPEWSIGYDEESSQLYIYRDDRTMIVISDKHNGLYEIAGGHGQFSVMFDKNAEPGSRLGVPSHGLPDDRILNSHQLTKEQRNQVRQAVKARISSIRS